MDCDSGGYRLKGNYPFLLWEGEAYPWVKTDNGSVPAKSLHGSNMWAFQVDAQTKQVKHGRIPRKGIIMKLIMKDNERAFLHKNGMYQRVIGPGKKTIWPFFGQNAIKVTAEGLIAFKGMNLTVLRKDAEFEKSTAFIEVPDDRLAVHFVDERIKGVLTPGTYAFWNIFENNTFELVELNDPAKANQLPLLYMAHIPPSYFTLHEVNEGEVGLLFLNGVYQRTLPSGRYYFWNYHTKVSVQKMETRVQQLDITGQEILTADKVGLRINFVCSYQITDPVSAVIKRKDYKEQLHILVQLVLREFAGKYRFDELLKQKDSIGGFVLERLKEREGEFFVTFLDAGVKDIVLPGEIRTIMNTVLVAEKTAQASVITRREETAATKSLLDTAKLMDENDTLFKLKELEYLERICDKVGTISVGSGHNILSSLRELVSGKA